jgi:tRNA(Ile)-lysidine synthase TilS/MesJ
MMKFNAIVGNPPYQIMDGGNAASAMPIYNKFVEISKLCKPQYISMIMPARWYAGGRGLNEFRDNMLNDRRYCCHCMIIPMEKIVSHLLLLLVVFAISYGKRKLQWHLFRF